MSQVLLVLFLEVFFEYENVLGGDILEAFLSLIDLEVLLLGEFNKGCPVVSNHVDLILVLLFDLIFVHSEHTELLDNFDDSQLHIHGSLANVIDDFEQVFDGLNGLHIALQLFFVLLSLKNDALQVLDGNVREDFTKGIQPQLNCIVGTRNDFVVVNEDQIVLLGHIV